MNNCRLIHVWLCSIVPAQRIDRGDMSSLTPDNVIIDGQRIAYGVYGAGIPVLLVHGTPSYSYIWRDVLPGLVDAGYRVFVYDLLGYGHSERPWDESIDTSGGPSVTGPRAGNVADRSGIATPSTRTWAGKVILRLVGVPGSKSTRSGPAATLAATSPESNA